MSEKAAQMGTSLPVATTAEQFPVYAIGMGESPRQRDKATPEGEITYASGCILRMLRKDGPKAEKAASVHVVDAAAIYELGVIYKAEGRVWVQPYTPDGGRMTFSITVERLVPAETSGGVTRQGSKNAEAA